MGLFTKQKKPDLLKGLPPPPLPSIEGKISADVSFPDLPELDLPPLPIQTNKKSFPVPPPPKPQATPKTKPFPELHLPELQVPVSKQAQKEQLMEPLDLDLPPLLPIEDEFDDKKSWMAEKTACTPQETQKDKELNDQDFTFPDLRFPEIPPMFRKPSIQKGEMPPQELPDLDLPELQSLSEERKPTRKARESSPLIQHGCLFIEMTPYTNILHGLHDTQDRVKTAGTAVEQLNALKNKEDSAIDALKTAIEGMQRKFQYLDKMLFESDAI